jgi:hypothetical protein
LGAKSGLFGLGTRVGVVVDVDGRCTSCSRI